MEQAKYLVRGYCGDTDGGYDDEYPADTLKEARERAKYLMGESYMRVVESEIAVSYVEILNTQTGEVVADFGEVSK